jgi:uncharacterized membrane protein YkvA (DUF1232 family)
MIRISLDAVLRSYAFSLARKMANADKKSGRSVRLLRKGAKQLGKIAPGAVLEEAKLGLRMVRAYHQGMYQKVPWKSIALMLAGLIYLAIPSDLIPDLIPLAGLGDDLLLLNWIISSLREDLQAFEAWEKAQIQPQTPKETTFVELI